ncbi:MAG TPA: hypothetical protein VNO17_02965 [Actinomycetota bacterium]|nr:hypothetical protein [Actinomycetota bacterium]
MSRDQRQLVIAAGALLTGLATAQVARRVGAPGEAVVPAGLIGLALGALVASRIVAAVEPPRRSMEDPPSPLQPMGVDAPAPAGSGQPISSVGPGAAPPLGAAGDGLTASLAGREDLRLFAPDQVAALPGALAPDERLAAVDLGIREGTPGLLAVTDRRVLFLPKAGDQEELALPDLIWVTLEEGTVTSTIRLGHPAGDVAYEVPAAGAPRLAGATGRSVRTIPAPPPPPPEPGPSAPADPDEEAPLSD